MNHFFKALSGLFIYSEPNKNKSFELLEGKDEGARSPDTNQSDEINETAQNAKTLEAKKTKGIKKPLNVEQWNEERDKTDQSTKSHSAMSKGSISAVGAALIAVSAIVISGVTLFTRY